MGQPFDLGIDGWDRLVRQHSWRPTEVGHAQINSSLTLDAGRRITVQHQVTTRPEKVRAIVACADHKSTRSMRWLLPHVRSTRSVWVTTADAHRDRPASVASRCQELAN